MAAKPSTTTSKKKKVAAKETSQSIEEQTKAFLEAGGKIDYINSGVSGQQNLVGPKHITLGNEPRG
ncbi:MAG: hypothetical protein EP297_01255 [Gammaproteobacteria bacterium]|nr:MAG: hypothetical protein EP297_01255 [Gammaproteobacteria bacterium]